MKRSVAFLLLFVVGCSTAPLANFLDFVRPGKLGPEKVPPYGGVSQPHPVGHVVAPPGTPSLPPPLPPGAGAFPPASPPPGYGIAPRPALPPRLPPSGGFGAPPPPSPSRPPAIITPTSATSTASPSISSLEISDSVAMPMPSAPPTPANSATQPPPPTTLPNATTP